MRLLITMVLLLCSNVTAYACPMLRTLTPDQMARAQTVFLGTVIKYYKPRNATPGKLRLDPTMITFEVQEVLLGRSATKQITVNWYPNWNMGQPSSLDTFIQEYGALTRVGILYPETFPEECRMVNVTRGGKDMGIQESCNYPFWGAKESKHPMIMSGACSTPFLFPANEASTFR